MRHTYVTIDGNEAAASIAFRTNEVIAIYPITPASPMGELADLWSTQEKKNVWGSVPQIVEMQSEGGAAGAVHGALQAGSLTTTFTASQGLLLMIPNMYKIAGELTSTVFHIAARSVAAQALSIFGDHSDVMAARSTGWGMLFANSVQEVMDFALIAQAATLESRVPFLHVFDGFRTSHEVQKIAHLSDDDVRALISDDLVRAHRARSLSPDRPFIRGTAQNPDVFFQARESVNPFYQAAPEIVRSVMIRFAERTGRRYGLFEYVGAPDAERVVVMMGSGCETTEETVNHLVANGEKVGLVKVRLYRPFSGEQLLEALPSTTKAIAVLDRTKEPGAAGEPLYQDVVTAVSEDVGSDAPRFDRHPRIIGGRYGLSSKEFTPAMVRAVFDELSREKPKNHFTIGIHDDVTHTSLSFDPEFEIEREDVRRAVFWGLGSDGTVGANKNSIKIIGEGTDFFAQGYFVYDSKKSGARTISHLRFGPRPIQSSYLIQTADFVAVHQFDFLDRYDVLDMAREGATFLLNSPHRENEVWDAIPDHVRDRIVDRKLRFFVVDAYRIAREADLGGRLNTIMQTCFFALSEVLPREQAIDMIKDAIRKSYGKRGPEVVEKNFAAVDATLAHLHEVKIPVAASAAASGEDLLVAASTGRRSDGVSTGSGDPESDVDLPGKKDRPTTGVRPAQSIPDDAPDFVRRVTLRIMAGEGDLLPVSALPVDGTFPSGTSKWEKRNLAVEVPVWDEDLCIQCGKCVMVCPHSAIRAKVVTEDDLATAPEGFLSAPAQWRELRDRHYTLQVAVEDCTGCTLCVDICPVEDKRQPGHKALDMVPQWALRDRGRNHWNFFLELPEITRAQPDGLKFTKTKDVQLLEPLFEFSGACAGCGETPYLILLSRLYGDRTIIANATGCSSIYGGNLPTTPWTTNRAGRGPAWSNSLFEDNAEFGLGMRLALDKQQAYAHELVERLRDVLGDELADALASSQTTPAEIEAQRERVAHLKTLLSEMITNEGNGASTAPETGIGKVLLSDMNTNEARDLASLADALVRKSVWIVGGDGWAYDIGFGGLDHVLSGNHNVNVLVLDTEVYSNTGGQASKATALGAVAKFAAGGKSMPKKDLGMTAINYGHVYVAQIVMGSDENQTIKAFEEAEAHDGPSLIIAYAPCIEHGIDLTHSIEQQQRAVKSGYWPLYRFDPRRAERGLSPMQLDSKAPSIPLSEYAYAEGRYRMLRDRDPEAAAAFLARAQQGVDERWIRYERMAGREVQRSNGPVAPGAKHPARPTKHGAKPVPSPTDEKSLQR